MIDFLTSLKWRGYVAAYGLYREWIKWNDHPWVWGRFACLGRRARTRLGSHLPLLNTVRGRVDFMLAAYSAGFQRPSTASIAKYVVDQCTLELLAEQQLVTWRFWNPPIAVLMDSFADLVGRLYVHRRTGASFAATLREVAHSPDFQARYWVKDLLSVEQIRGHYFQLFSLFESEFGRIPIVFLHYPPDFEYRELYIARHDGILEATRDLSSHFKQLRIITAPPGTVESSEDPLDRERRFPYHYGAKTYEAFAEQLRQLPFCL